jgi:hypothetical protein
MTHIACEFVVRVRFLSSHDEAQRMVDEFMKPRFCQRQGNDYLYHFQDRADADLHMIQVQLMPGVASATVEQRWE